jgi:isoaspartyl peptidase/L-asparaginase-like protein (Ntn-hydrolase superfamily)
MTAANMSTNEKIEELLNQIAELPEAAQDELVRALVEMRAENLGIYVLDDEDRAALARSAEDIRVGRFASDQEIYQMFTSYGA